MRQITASSVLSAFTIDKGLTRKRSNKVNNLLVAANREFMVYAFAEAYIRGTVGMNMCRVIDGIKNPNSRA